MTSREEKIVDKPSPNLNKINDSSLLSPINNKITSPTKLENISFQLLNKSNNKTTDFLTPDKKDLSEYTIKDPLKKINSKLTEINPLIFGKKNNGSKIPIYLSSIANSKNFNFIFETRAKNKSRNESINELNSNFLSNHNDSSIISLNITNNNINNINNNISNINNINNINSNFYSPQNSNIKKIDIRLKLPKLNNNHFKLNLKELNHPPNNKNITNKLNHNQSTGKLFNSTNTYLNLYNNKKMGIINKKDELRPLKLISNNSEFKTVDVHNLKIKNEKLNITPLKIIKNNDKNSDLILNNKMQILQKQNSIYFTPSITKKQPREFINLFKIDEDEITISPQKNKQNKVEYSINNEITISNISSIPQKKNNELKLENNVNINIQNDTKNDKKNDGNTKKENNTNEEIKSIKTPQKLDLRSDRGLGSNKSCFSPSDKIINQLTISDNSNNTLHNISSSNCGDSVKDKSSNASFQCPKIVIESPMSSKSCLEEEENNNSSGSINSDKENKSETIIRPKKSNLRKEVPENEIQKRNKTLRSPDKKILKFKFDLRDLPTGLKKNNEGESFSYGRSSQSVKNVKEIMKSPTMRRRISSTKYFDKYICNTLERKKSMKIITETKNLKFIGHLENKNDIYAKNRFLKKLYSHIGCFYFEGNDKLIKFAKMKVILKNKVELTNILGNKKSEELIQEEKQKEIQKEIDDYTKYLVTKQNPNIPLITNDKIENQYISFLLSVKNNVSIKNALANYITETKEISTIFLPKMSRNKKNNINCSKLILDISKNKFPPIFSPKSKFIEKKSLPKTFVNIIYITVDRFLKDDLSFMNKEEKDEVPPSIFEKKVMFKRMKTLESIKMNADKYKSTKICSSRNIDNKYGFDRKAAFSKIKMTIKMTRIKKNINTNKYSLLANKNFYDEISKNRINYINKEKRRSVNESNCEDGKLPYLINDKGKLEMFDILKALMIAGENTKFVEYVYSIINNVDVNQKDSDGNTLLILSAKQGFTFLVQKLVEKGANINAQNLMGNTALHYAISQKYFKIADILAKYGAREDIYNIFGLSPWECIGKSVEERTF